MHRQTEGNPLFVEEVGRYLVEAGPDSEHRSLEQLAQDSIEWQVACRSKGTGRQAPLGTQ